MNFNKTQDFTPRDMIAMQAMQGMIAASKTTLSNLSAKDIAHNAYRIANEMIKKKYELEAQEAKENSFVKK